MCAYTGTWMNLYILGQISYWAATNPIKNCEKKKEKKMGGGAVCIRWSPLFGTLKWTLVLLTKSVIFSLFSKIISISAKSPQWIKTKKIKIKTKALIQVKKNWVMVHATFNESRLMVVQPSKYTAELYNRKRKNVTPVTCVNTAWIIKYCLQRCYLGLRMR